jgi:hypothetical protein
VVIPEPPLTIRTQRGEYYIQLIWNPPIEAPTAEAGDNATSTAEEFGIVFMNDRQEIVTGVTYGFTVTSSNGTTIEELANQKAIDGTSTQSVVFPAQGGYAIEVRIESVAGQPLGMFVESAKFGVVAE